MTNQLPYPDNYFPESKQVLIMLKCQLTVKVTHARVVRLLLLVSIKPHYKTSNYGLCSLHTVLQSNKVDPQMWLVVLFQTLTTAAG